MSAKICPYPGLRPFTEEESIFFKGRDVHIRQIIKQLEEKKIIIITGASGDGKSSLVYAGVIPNARAGFFRAKHNNWQIIDFRPERSPLRNLANAFSTQLNLDTKNVYDEFSYGFSALIDRYKSSEYYLNTQNNAWKAATKKEQNKKKLKASNLLILADQFEEFFTNTENFSNGKPSTEAYTTVNLLLETASIAIAEDLPIYIVFTMRSDFISQSVAFKGLPECIGFSQFFVPRLKRNEMQQVIEEPALLSGGTVAQRLVEVLINGLSEGFDQLPLLQHILNRLWNTANNGNQDLDLLHLAKLAGLPSQNLPTEDKKDFDVWFDKIKPFRKKYYKNQSLKNVLNTHANTLYDKAYNFFKENIDWAETNISSVDAALIIKTAFQSLTKIDDGRGVRNRMTLHEITQIINNPHITYEQVCGVINIYRLPDSTFIRPFIDIKNIESQYVSSDTVLDITHEALIRNWELLKNWENEEIENLQNFNDFKVQLGRWKYNYRSQDFLLPIGPLSHFEDWYKKCSPNAYWIAKYDNSNLSKEQKIDNATELADDTASFISESRNRIIKLEKQKRKRQIIILAAATIVIVILSGFSYWAMLEKKNADQQKSIAVVEQKKATESSKIAQTEKEKADEASKTAQLEKKRAEENAKIASENANEARMAKLQSDEQRKRAERNKNIAQKQSKLAKTETTKALEAMKTAKEERKKAEIASENAKRLSALALAQSLSLKAKVNYNDPQINLLLAVQAYKLNIQNGGNKNSPAIFDALQTALKIANYDNIIYKANNIISDFYPLTTGNFRFISNKMLLFDLSPKTGGKEIFEIKTNTIPIEKSFIINDQYAIVGLQDRTAHLISTKNNDIIELKGNNGFIRTFDIDPNNNLLTIGDRGGNIVIRNLKNPTETIKTIKTKKRINSLLFSSNKNNIIAACADGSVIKIDIEKASFKEIHNWKERITSIISIENKGIIVAGFSNGYIRTLQEKTGKQDEFIPGRTGIEILCTNSNDKLMAATGADKIIWIYQMDDLTQAPLSIGKLPTKIKKMKFVGENTLYTLNETNELIKWECSPAKLMEKAKELIKRDLTPKEHQILFNNVK